MDETNLPTNRLAIFSLVSAILTILSFCIGWAPFLPLTGLVCYPAAIFFGALALISGLAALRGIRNSGENGIKLALTGVLLGGLTILVTLCAVSLTISAIAAFINQLWMQSQH